jgi:hypothetical protein
MIIDYISPEKLPHVVLWLDWNFYAHKTSLLICIVLMNIHHIYQYTKDPTWQFTIEGVFTASFVGFCLWCFYLAINQGYGIG